MGSCSCSRCPPWGSLWAWGGEPITGSRRLRGCQGSSSALTWRLGGCLEPASDTNCSPQGRPGSGTQPTPGEASRSQGTCADGGTSRGCCSRPPHTWWLTATGAEAEVQDQGEGRAGLPGPQVGPSCLPAAGLQGSLGCGCFTPVSVTVPVWPSPLCALIYQADLHSVPPQDTRTALRPTWTLEAVFILKSFT